MRYLHYITETKTDKQIESVYSESDKRLMSLEFFASTKKYTYRIWDRQENTVTRVNLYTTNTIR